jgi:UDP-N-acetylmuramate dehydrogenase
MFDDIKPDLTLAMPDLRGELSSNVPLAPWTWFKTGGRAQIVFVPADAEDLAYFLARLDPIVPVMPLGLGSNLLVRDAGVDGVVIALGPSFGDLSLDETTFSVGAGAADVKLSSMAAMTSIAGFSFLRGIPGSIGGALRMNAGAFGGEIKNVFVACEGVTRDGELRTFDADAMQFSYRHSGVSDVIFTRARLRGTPGDQEKIRAEMSEIARERSATQPVNTRTGGSTFRNPPGHKAWQLIDAAGCRGLTIGDAQVSELHCNFLVNRGKATSEHIETLGETVRARVFETSGIHLQWEIERVGIELL